MLAFVLFIKLPHRIWSELWGRHWFTRDHFRRSVVSAQRAHSLLHWNSTFLFSYQIFKSTQFLIFDVMRVILRFVHICDFVHLFADNGIDFISLSNFGLCDDISLSIIFTRWIARSFFTSFKLVLDVEWIETIHSMIMSRYELQILVILVDQPRIIHRILINNIYCRRSISTFSQSIYRWTLLFLGICFFSSVSCLDVTHLSWLCIIFLSHHLHINI